MADIMKSILIFRIRIAEADNQFDPLEHFWYNITMKRFWESFWEILETVIIAGVTVFLIRSYLVQPFLVSGASMDPNIAHGNYLIIDQLTKRFQKFQQGDVVVFHYPNDPDTFYIKRIIGLPGDQVRISDGNVFINGELLKEDYLSLNIGTFGSADITLAGDQYFVLGDNRDNSSDSRSWGALQEQFIVGLARLRLFPFNQITIIPRPAYGH